jgi:cysteinyl-tRNA synthetase
LLDALFDDLNTPEAVTVLREGYKLARDGEMQEKTQFLMDCQFLGILRHDKLWVHMLGVMGRNTRNLPLREDLVRPLRVSVANNLPALQEEALRNLASQGLGAEIANDGNVTVVPLSQAAKDTSKHIDELIFSRNEARKSRNFVEADRIRGELAQMGIELEDHKDGSTTVKVKR